MTRFLSKVEKHGTKKKLVLREMGLGLKSAPIISQIIRMGNSLAEWSHIDLSFNKLGSNLAPLILGLKKNVNLV